jgi:phosphoribosylformylglycinamidine synthase
VVRIGDGPKGLALTTDVVARYCAADPVQGGRQVVAEAWRNLIAVGARPLAITDNLNFGNPERPEIMGQFVGCLQGIGEACRALDFPVVSGNVSLYNETRGQGILPTPSIGGVGVVEDVAKIATPAFKGAGHVILLIGKTQGWLGQSTYLSELCGREEGSPPPVDLVEERRNGEFVGAAINAGRVTAVHDLAEGGLGVALAEMAIDGRVGARIDRLPDGVPAHGVLFGEGQARYLVTATLEAAEALAAEAEAAGVQILRLGETGGDALILPDLAAIPVAELVRVHEDWLPSYMAGAPSPTN